MRLIPSAARDRRAKDKKLVCHEQAGLGVAKIGQLDEKLYSQCDAGISFAGERRDSDQRSATVVAVGVSAKKQVSRRDSAGGFTRQLCGKLNDAQCRTYAQRRVKRRLKLGAVLAVAQITVTTRQLPPEGAVVS